MENHYERVNFKRGGKNREIKPGSMVRIKLANGSISEPIEVIDASKTRVKTVDLRVWPMRKVYSPRKLYNEVEEENVIDKI